MAWSLSTGAAVTLSWWGVHTVMSGTAYDRPRALPINADAAIIQGAGPQVSSTNRPQPPPASKPAERDGNRKPPASTPGGKKRTGKSPSLRPAYPPPASGNVKGYTVDGGRVVFDIGTASAELVTATPDAGWQMQVWKQPEWIRVTFTRNGREVSVFCTWNGHPPMVEFDDR